jgi:penicillin amidase
MRVENIDEFEGAVDRMGEMTYNFVAADADNISYRVGVDIPARNRPADGRKPWQLMDGGDPEAIWPEGKFLAPEQKPRSRGASTGYIVTANNDPFGFTGDGDVTNDDFYYGAFFPPGWRASRIDAEVNRLIAAGPVSVDMMETLQMDAHSNLADDILPVMTTSYAAVGTDMDLAEFQNRPDLDQLVQVLTDWDRQMTRDSSGAVAFHAFAHLLTQIVLQDDLTVIFFPIIMEAAPMYLLKVAMLALTDQYPTEDVFTEGKNRVVLMALDQTAAFLVDKFGTVDPSAYQFSDMRVSDLDYAYGRPVEIKKVPTDGGETTVNVAQSTFFDGVGAPLDQWVAHWGPVERQVMSFDENGTPYSHANFALGNVADPASPHFDDALDGWVNGEYRKLLFARSEIDAKTESRIVLKSSK